MVDNNLELQEANELAALLPHISNDTIECTTCSAYVHKVDPETVAKVALYQGWKILGGKPYCVSCPKSAIAWNTSRLPNGQRV